MVIKRCDGCSREIISDVEVQEQCSVCDAAGRGVFWMREWGGHEGWLITWDEKKGRKFLNLFVSLIYCKDCKCRWVEEHDEDETWEADRCGHCGGEGSSVILKELGDGFAKNIWVKADVLITWAERSGCVSS